MAALLHGSQHRENRKLRLYIDEIEVLRGLREKKNKIKTQPEQIHT